MIRLKRINKTYGGKFKLEDLDLQIDRGKFVSLLGPNGAGKTTASFTILPEILDCKEFVNADDIAKGDPRIALKSGHEVNRQFRRAGTESHDGQTDEQGRDTESFGHGGSSAHHQITTPKKKPKTQNQYEKINCHIKDPVS